MERLYTAQTPDGHCKIKRNRNFIYSDALWYFFPEKVHQEIVSWHTSEAKAKEAVDHNPHLAHLEWGVVPVFEISQLFGMWIGLDAKYYLNTYSPEEYVWKMMREIVDRKHDLTRAHDMAGLCHAYREAINNALPAGLILIDRSFKGDKRGEWSMETICSYVRHVDVTAIAPRYRRAD